MERVLRDGDGAPAASCSRTARSCGAAVLSNADPLRTAAPGRRARARRLAAGRAGRQGDAAARRAARLPLVAGARAVGGDDRHRLHARRPRRGRGRRARAGRPAARPWIEAACQTAADPSLAPEGRHVLSLFCQCFPADVDAEAAADTAIARFAEVCPGLPDRVVDRLALGPRELGGALRHHRRAHLPRRDARRPDPHPALRAARVRGRSRLYLAGSGAHPGGAVTGAPGYLAARAVLDDLAGRERPYHRGG